MQEITGIAQNKQYSGKVFYPTKGLHLQGLEMSNEIR
jgi:hypothetical protein